jgi:predicted site-specific integrase-resolvase
MSFKSEYVSNSEAAAELGVTDRTLARWRAEGKGPAYTRVGGRIYYRRNALTEHARAVEVQPVRNRAA